MDKTYYVYIITNINNTVLYIGVTNDLRRRIYEHKSGLAKGSFSKRYKLTKLVYYEATNDVRAALVREKQLKNWAKKWKIELIENSNPEFDNLNIV